MRDISPWDQLNKPSADLNVRLIPEVTAVPCYWGKDAEGHYLFILELDGDHTEQYKKRIAPVNGIHVDLRGGDGQQQRLLLTLENENNRDLFWGLCRTLITTLGRAKNSADSLTTALLHIRRWKAFFSGKNAIAMSAAEVRGLFAELIFLQELLLSSLAEFSAVNAWLGPERSHQDFIFGNTAVEIKSLSGAERSSVRISSEDQLESLNAQLFLRIYKLSASNEHATARSLNELISSLQDMFESPLALDTFNQKLVTQGYAPLAEYEENRFVVTETRTYNVHTGFPKLVRSDLPVGIDNVGYDIRLESIASYACNNDDVFEGL